MPDLRAALGRRLRNAADRIDPTHAPRGSGMSFTFEVGKGAVLRWDRHGRPLWYLGEDDYGRAYSEADTEWQPRAFDAEAEIQRLAASLRAQGGNGG